MSAIFFYGTLLHPEVLRRVIGNKNEHLEVAPAVLLNHTRHHGCDYPAIVPYVQAKDLFAHELTREERSVRGTVVTGLIEEEMRLLDIFEGDEYTRETVLAAPLGPFCPLLESIESLISPEEPFPELHEFIEVQTYIWADRLERLMPEVWSFDVFVKEKLWRWIGKGSSNNADYAIVDERRALNGNIKASHASTTLEANEPPEFGRSLLSQFLFHKDYINLNHGSYGSLPRPVADACDVLAREIEERPDKYLRRDYYVPLKAVRERVAHLIGAHTDEVVLVPNATHGINTILRNFEWKAGDVLVEAVTTYGAVMRTVQYIHDCAPHPSISVMELPFPLTHEEIVKRFRDHLQGIPRHEGQKVVAIIDSIISNPGCVLPWKKMVQVCKEEKVWSLIDAAHSIGQEMNISLNEAQPDFWVSNCHKWLYSKRGCSVLYVPFRNQHIIRSSIPTSIGYVSPEDLTDPTPKASNFVVQFEWTGTIDFVPFFSVLSALEFREKLGGEKRINDYCHALAVKGGKRLAQIFQTTVSPEELTANMCNVVLPLPIPSDFPQDKLMEIRRKMEAKMIDEWDCFTAVFPYGGKWWTRCSAQVFNQLSDFDHVAKALSAICADLRKEYGI